uniref:Neuroendocrine secretory protein 55 n=1 Tax=Bos indicus x Bos taurus TaxID=30522 RepID=A0A4W2I7S5_BOBOX
DLERGAPEETDFPTPFPIPSLCPERQAEARSFRKLSGQEGRRAATALLWLSCSIALLRALATSSTRAQQRAAAQRRTFLNAHHRSAAQVFPEPPESDHEDTDFEPSLPECPEYQEEEFDYESETESESEIESETEFETESDTAPTTEPETEPEDEPGPAVPKRPTFHQSLTERLSALRLRSPDASPSRAPPSTQESESPRQGEEPEDKDPRDPEESEEPKEEEKQQQHRCKPKKPTRRDPSPESPSKRGAIPIRRH